MVPTLTPKDQPKPNAQWGARGRHPVARRAVAAELRVRSNFTDADLAAAVQHQFSVHEQAEAMALYLHGRRRSTHRRPHPDRSGTLKRLRALRLNRAARARRWNCRKRPMRRRNFAGCPI